MSIPTGYIVELGLQPKAGPNQRSDRETRIGVSAAYLSPLIKFPRLAAFHKPGQRPKTVARNGSKRPR